MKRPKRNPLSEEATDAETVVEWQCRPWIEPVARRRATRACKSNDEPSKRSFLATHGAQRSDDTSMPLNTFYPRVHDGIGILENTGAKTTIGAVQGYKRCPRPPFYRWSIFLTTEWRSPLRYVSCMRRYVFLYAIQGSLNSWSRPKLRKSRKRSNFLRKERARSLLLETLQFFLCKDDRGWFEVNWCVAYLRAWPRTVWERIGLVGKSRCSQTWPYPTIWSFFSTLAYLVTN